MHLKGLDLNLLVVLDALFAEKSITHTGQRINLSQSATSGVSHGSGSFLMTRFWFRWGKEWN